MVNRPGVYGVIAALFRPGLVVPHVIVADISQLRWTELQKAGVSHVVIDKDNCITVAHKDEIVAELQESWTECTESGFRTVLIVSNSAGSSKDPLGVGAEYLSGKLGQLVLAHPSMKPATSCARQALDVIMSREEEQRQQQQQLSSSSSKSPSPGHILVIGDRITTDIILASRMQRLLQKRQSSRQAIGVLTTSVHAPESMLTSMMRRLEMLIVMRLIKAGIRPGASWRTSSSSSTPSPSINSWQSIATGEQPEDTYSSSSVREMAAQEAEEMAPAAPLSDRFRAFPGRVNGFLYMYTARSLSWLGAGWSLINDGIHLGTKGFIGTPDPALRRIRHSIEDRGNLSAHQLKSITSSSVTRRTAKPFPPISRRALSTRKSAPSNPFPSPNRLRGWPGAIAALILMPTCWFGGVYLHESRERKKEKEEPRQIPPSLQQMQTEQQQQSGGFNTAPPSLGMQGPGNRTLLTVRHHLQRELEDIDKKLQRLEERQRMKDSQPKAV